MKLASWTPEYWDERQHEVWNTLEEHWGCLIGKKIDKFLSFIHADFIGYGHESPIPVDRPWLEKWVGFWAQSTKIVICELRPINLKVHDNGIAILQYMIFTIEESAGSCKRVIRRYTMTWNKTEDGWKVIASHNNLMSHEV